MATGVAPRRSHAVFAKSEAKMRIFLPLKSARWRIALFEMMLDCAARNIAAP